MPRKLDQDITKILRAMAEDLPQTQGALAKLWGAMTPSEKRSLLSIEPARNLIALGGHAAQGDQQIDENTQPEDLDVDITDIDVWLASARQHAEDAGEWEHELGDLEDLVTACTQILGAERTVAAMTAR